MRQRWFTATCYVVLCCGLALTAAGCGLTGDQGSVRATNTPVPAVTAAGLYPASAARSSDVVIACATPAPYPPPAQPYPPPHTPTPTNTPRPYPLPPTASPAYPAP